MKYAAGQWILFPRVCLIRLNLLNMLLIIVLDLGLNFSHFVVIFCSVLDDMALMLMMFSLTSLVTFVMLHTLSSKFTPERISMKIRIYNQVAGRRRVCPHMQINVALRQQVYFCSELHGWICYLNVYWSGMVGPFGLLGFCHLMYLTLSAVYALISDCLHLLYVIVCVPMLRFI